MGNFDRETEIADAIAQSGVARQDAEIIVDIVNELRGTGVNNTGQLFVHHCHS